jgi:hypothetical protein
LHTYFHFHSHTAQPQASHKQAKQAKQTKQATLTLYLSKQSSKQQAASVDDIWPEKPEFVHFLLSTCPDYAYAYHKFDIIIYLFYDE